MIPSPRPSHRVPFGTGKAVGEILATGDSYQTYSPNSFEDLRVLFSQIDDLSPESEFPKSIAAFLETQPFAEAIGEIRANVTSSTAFRTRFFRWFDAFRIMKYVHFARDHFHPSVPVQEASSHLANWLEWPKLEGETEAALLERFRKWDRGI